MISFPKLFVGVLWIMSSWTCTSGFLQPSSSSFSRYTKKEVVRAFTKKTLSSSSRSSLFLFEDDDISSFNALCQFGPAPFFVRVTQPTKYWEAVENFQQKEKTTKVLAVRNMDAYFADPIGWGLRREREKEYGEVVDYTQQTGVQKRPVFSLFMLVLTGWFFFNFLPTRVNELGGLKPSALNGGLCPPDVRVMDANGKQRFECKPKSTLPQ